MELSVVTTMYYSQPYLKEFYNRTLDAIRRIGVTDYEMLFVNDGSPDDSASVILQFHKENPRVKLIDLSRNFGHHNAIMAGLRAAKGDWVFLIDCDLEEDPELLVEFWKYRSDAANADVDVIYGIQEKRKGNFFERISGQLFYDFLDLFLDVKYPSNTLTARIMRSRYVQSVTTYPEKSLEIWGIFLLAGYKQLGVTTTKKYKGSTTYTLSKKLKMAIETITSLSNKPLYIIFYIGMITFIISTLYILYVIIHSFYADMSTAMGWSSIIASIWMVGGLIILLLGIISIYLSKIFVEVKNRPLYIIKKTTDEIN
ncbi:MAG: glycosyltransferase family 2 protein [Chitinophagales bacterium]|nr:glycosyltransferase family 2 protein [Chitinophagales bacterium]MDW8418993.1 glycosyltransferase family 2 protein [Chitinophagales bacterium]